MTRPGRWRHAAIAVGFAVPFLLVAAYAWARAVSGGFRLVPLPGARFWASVWACAVLGGATYGFAKRDAWRGVGLALMTVPLWVAAWGFVNSVPRLADPGSFIPARSRYDLSTSYMRSLLVDLGYVGSGFLVWTLGSGLPTSLRGLAARARDSTVALVLPGRSEGRSAAAGWLWFPVVLGVTIALDYLVRSQAPQLINGDESQVWKNMTLFHAFLISAAAAVTEEIVYRGVLLTIVVVVARRVGLSGSPASNAAAWGLAVVAQAVLFGLAHGGYGTIVHVLGPFAFGIVTGIATVRYGLWSAIVLHFLIDFYVFATYAVPGLPWLAVALWTLLLVNVATTLGAAGAWLTRRVRGAAT